MLLRSASLAWTASTVLHAVGVLLTASWIWSVVRGQQQASEYYGGGFDGEDTVSIVDRIDLLTQGSFHFLAYAALVTAAALALRLLADVAAVRAGGFSGQAGQPPTAVVLERDDD